ncbi:hypothetical protein Golomagni_03132, partial [Golovinomyces magnicellulatus]
SSSYSFNWTQVIQFVIFTALNSPPNYIWQTYLENSFPSSHLSISPTEHQNKGNHDPRGKKPEQKSKPRLLLKNTFIKFFLDQTIGACVNTLFFLIVLAGLRGASIDEAITITGREFWPVMTAGWKLWPAISAINFGVVKTVKGRTLIGSFAGMAWGIYLSLIRS